MRASLTQREYLGWAKYWAAEPWGPWRDNIHAAIVARELAVQRRKPGAKVTIDEFMVRDPDERRREGSAAILSTLRLLATRKPKK